MPLPAVLGLPALGLFLASVVTSVVNFWVNFLTKKIAIRLVGIAALVAFTATFVVAIQATLATIEYAVPSSIQTGASWILPTNFGTCLTAVLGTYATRWAYDWNVKIVQLKLF